MSRAIYLAGPMSNIPKYNFPMFEAVAIALRAEGFTIISPHECDSLETQAAAWASPDGKFNPNVESESWGTCLARDVKMLADGYVVDVESLTGRENLPAEQNVDSTVVPIDGIAFLPGWENSKGARLEAFVGLLTGKGFYRVMTLIDSDGQPEGYYLVDVPAEWIQSQLAAPWAEAIRAHTPQPPVAHAPQHDHVAVSRWAPGL